MPGTLTLNKQDTFYFQYDAAADLVRGGWLAPVLDADLRSHYAQLLRVAQQHGCCCWLLDMRGRNWHMPSFGQWFSTEFVAAVQAALGQPVFIAYLLSPRHHSAADTVREQHAQHESRAQQVYPAAFADEAAALAWLSQQRPGAPALG
jgi:hypothetical protein